MLGADFNARPWRGQSTIFRYQSPADGDQIGGGGRTRLTHNANWTGGHGFLPSLPERCLALLLSPGNLIPQGGAAAANRRPDERPLLSADQRPDAGAGTSAGPNDHRALGHGPLLPNRHLIAIHDLPRRDRSRDSRRPFGGHDVRVSEVVINDRSRLHRAVLDRRWRGKRTAAPSPSRSRCTRSATSPRHSRPPASPASVDAVHN